MIELIFTTCLLTAPDTCRERHLVYTEALSPMACLMGAQPELAKWNAAHPKWRIGNWKCRAVNTAMKDA